MTIVTTDPRTDQRWHELARRHPHGSLFHSAEWHIVLADTYGFPVEAVMLLDTNGDAQAGITYCRLHDIRGERIVSLPFSDHCDPLVSTMSEWQQLITPLIGSSDQISLRSLHNTLPNDDARFSMRKQACWHYKVTTDDEDTLWRSVKKTARHTIQYVKNKNVRVRSATYDELQVFYQMHLGIRKYKYHLLAQPFSFFDNIWQQFMARGQGQLMVATLDDVLIGAVMYLVWNNTLMCKFSTSNPDFSQYSPSDVLFWEGIRYASEQGYTSLDFGLSDLDQEGLIRFKDKFTRDQGLISFMETTSAASNSVHRQINSLLPALTDLLTDPSVPDDITESAGDLLYSFFA